MMLSFVRVGHGGGVGRGVGHDMVGGASSPTHVPSVEGTSAWVGLRRRGRRGAPARACHQLHHAGSAHGVRLVTGAFLGARSITSSPTTVEVNEANGNVYVAHQGVGDRVSVYSSDLTLLTELPLTNPWGPSVNTSTGRVYVANTYGGDVWVVDSATNTLITTIALAGASTLGTAVDESRNIVYAVDRYSNELYVIDGTTNTVVDTLVTGNTPSLSPSTSRTARCT